MGGAVYICMVSSKLLSKHSPQALQHCAQKQATLLDPEFVN